MLLELDAIGSSECMEKTGALGAWEADIRYEINKVSTLPHVVAYIEGGYSDAEGPRYTARVLRAVGVSKIRGFFTNDTHENWTIDEINWGEQVSRLAGGTHFIVNTAQNGNGPLRNPHPGRQGNSDLCNPPGRAIGTAADHQHRLPAGGRVPVERSARQQQRPLPRRAQLRRVLAGPGDRPRLARQLHGWARTSRASPTNAAAAAASSSPATSRAACGLATARSRRAHRGQTRWIRQQRSDLLRQPRGR